MCILYAKFQILFYLKLLHHQLDGHYGWSWKSVFEVSKWKSLSQESGVANSQKPWKANLFNLPRDLKSWSTKLPRLCFTLYTLMLESTFSILFFGHFLSYWQGDWLNRQNFLGWWSFPLFSRFKEMIQKYYCKEKLDAGHS